MIARLPVVLLVAALVGAAPARATPSRTETLLQAAEAARSSNPEAFRSAIESLRGIHPGDATPRQRERIAYLDAYATAYSGGLDDGIEKAKRLARETRDPEMSYRAGALIVNSYALSGRYREGLRQLEQTLQLLPRLRDAELRVHGLVAAGTLYHQMGQYELAAKYAQQILAAPSSGRATCFANYLQFDSQRRLGKVAADEASIEQAIAQCMVQREVMMANFLRALLAQKWHREGKQAAAIDLLATHLEEAKATKYARLVAEFQSLLGEWLLVRGELSAAERHAREATEAGPGATNTPPIVSALRTLYRVAEERGDAGEAFERYKRFASAEMVYVNEIKSRELAYHIVRQETRQKTQQVELLKKQNQVLQLQRAVDRQAAQNSRLLTMLLLVLASLVGYWAYQIKRRHSTLREQAETDALTGVSNRHHFTIEGGRSLAQCAQAGESVALIMFDLDHFKSINDNYGHITGDWVLKRVADTCKTFCRKIDQLGRLGGEEFAILVHGFDASGAARLAEDCRMRIAGIDTSESGYTFAVTGSFGVSTTALSGYDLSRLLAHADQMLYRAKREGRNRVCIYTAETPTPFGTAAHTASVEVLADAWDEALPSRTRTP